VGSIRATIFGSIRVRSVGSNCVRPIGSIRARPAGSIGEMTTKAPRRIAIREVRPSMPGVGFVAGREMASVSRFG